MPPLLEARHLRKVFRSGGQRFGPSTETIAVSEFSLSIDADRPSFTTIAGESGSGKTTIARMLLGVLNPSSGEVLYQGRDVHDLQKEERRQFRKDVQAIFQDPFEVYNPFYKIDHILTTPVRKFGLAESKADAYDKIREALRTVGLRPEETLGRYPHQLSGGQRQRITIARALLLKPKLIIADEPVSMVDASLRATILSTLHALYRDFRHFLYLHHPRSDDRISSQREYRRLVPRGCGRSRPYREGDQGSAASLYARVNSLDSRARAGARVDRRSSGRKRSGRYRGYRGRGGRCWLPLCAALSPSHGPVCGRAAVLSARSRAGGGLFSAR